MLSRRKMSKSQSSRKDEQESADQELNYPLGFPFDEDVPHTLGGKIYQWVKNRYYENRRPWNKSDVFVWKGACLHMGSWVGILIFASIFGWLFLKTYSLYGIGKLVSLVSVIVLIRLNFLIKLLNEINTNLKEINKKTPR